MFFNELDLLELRLEYLYDSVDYFVIVEGRQTHSGKNSNSGQPGSDALASVFAWDNFQATIDARSTTAKSPGSAR